MNSLRKKTTATLLIAILSLTMMTVLMSASATFDLNGDLFWGTKAKWSIERYHSGPYSVHLNYEPVTPGPESGNVIIPVNLPLSEIASKPSSYFVNLVTLTDPERPFADYPYYPEIVLMMDVDGSGYVHGGAGDDYLFGEWAYYRTGEAGDDIEISAKNTWTKIDINDPNLLFWDRNAGIDENRVKGTATLKNLQWYVDNNDDGSESDPRYADLTYAEKGPFTVDITGDSIVRYVVVQSWLGYEAFVDDIVLGGNVFLDEPASTATMGAEVALPTVSISLSVTDVDFGRIVAGGDSSMIPVTIYETGKETDTLVTATIVEDGTFYYDTLKLGGSTVSTWSLTLDKSTHQAVSLQLMNVPRIPGNYAGTLVFWAEEAP